MELKCAPCTDQHISNGQNDAGIPDAITIVTVMQTFAAGGQQVAAPVMLPVCYDCRKKMLVAVSKNGLVTA